jgi:Zn-dependent peptidase ImmA (M78 family)
MSADPTTDPFFIIAQHQKKAPVPVVKLAHALGLEVRRRDLGDKWYGMLMRNKNSERFAGFTIYVNQTSPPNRRRFTIAHEIAHYILHRDLIDTQIMDDTMYRSDLPDIYETQANRLAADILMPVHLVKKEFRANPDLGELARLFEVSKAAMSIRLRGLGLEVN